MDLIAKKYTILMNEEPLDIWIKNGQVKRATFMNQKVAVDFDKEVLDQFKKHPTRVINGALYQQNKEFTQPFSKMMSQKLETAIAKNDKKTLSRFARSELVPDEMKQDFIQAINRQNGIHGMLKRAANKTNEMFQNIAKKIDKFFDRLTDSVVNQKLDEHLQKYQLKEFNKLSDELGKDWQKQHFDPKLHNFVERFVERNQAIMLDKSHKLHQEKLNELLEQGVAKGFNSRETNIVFHQEVERVREQNSSKELESSQKEQSKIIRNLEEKLKRYELQEAGKNETLKDFKTLTKEMSAVNKIDVLIENKEYLKLPFEEQMKVENDLLKEPIAVRAEIAKDLVKVAKEVQQTKQEAKTIIEHERMPNINFKESTIKEEVAQKWQELQKINKEQQAQNRDFMNISAVRFNGVSQKSLEKWQTNAVKHGVKDEIAQKFVDATLRNATELEKAGIFKQTEQGEFRFKDSFAKETLYQNLNKPVAELQELNKGVKVEVQQQPQKHEVIDEIKAISSEKSFEKIVSNNGEIDPQKLQKFADRLSEISKTLENSKNVNMDKRITMDDLKHANNQQQTHSHNQTQGQGQER